MTVYIPIDKNIESPNQGQSINYLSRDGFPGIALYKDSQYLEWHSIDWEFMDISDDVGFWLRQVELPSINELRCLATDQANLNGEVDKIDYLEGFVKASEYILSLLKPKN